MLNEKEIEICLRELPPKIDKTPSEIVSDLEPFFKKYGKCGLGGDITINARSATINSV